jgi:hypothetical protein
VPSHLHGAWQTSHWCTCPCFCHRDRQLECTSREEPEHAQGAISAGSVSSSRQMRHMPGSDSGAVAAGIPQGTSGAGEGLGASAARS